MEDMKIISSSVVLSSDEIAKSEEVQMELQKFLQNKGLIIKNN
jgi:hypothetical protein